MLTHFSSAGVPDRERIHRHLDAIRGEVRGILVPGSTGEGWEMTDEDILAVLDVFLEKTAETGQKVLIGILKTDAAGVVAGIRRIVGHLLQWTGTDSWQTAFLKSGEVGFTVCPPSGADLEQSFIREALASVLDLGYPTALYQLPQVTRNEMTPETVSALAAEYSNFYLFKDTSGEDVVARAGKEYHGLFLVRGAEGRYAFHPRTGGGLYDGFLLSTANTFASELGAILSHLRIGEHEPARRISRDMEDVVAGMFSAVSDFPVGNPFANANKALDHVRAWGDSFLEHDAPLLYSGTRLPQEFLSLAQSHLQSKGFRMDHGYLNRRD